MDEHQEPFVACSIPSKIDHAQTVSIGMPVYNGANYIEESLGSLLSQTFSDFELIISDNASTDATSAICQEYAQNDARIRYIRQTSNLGPVANFKFVLEQARCKYFMWAAHDDRWAPTFLEKMVALLEEDQDCSVAFSNYIVRNLDTGEESFHKILPSGHNSPICNYVVRVLNMRPSLIYGLYRAKDIEKIAIESFDYSDVHFVSEVAIGKKVKIENDYLYVAGIKGGRVPYSITGKKIERAVFLRKQYNLLKNYFSFPIACSLFALLCLVMAYSRIKLWRY